MADDAETGKGQTPKNVLIGKGTQLILLISYSAFILGVTLVLQGKPSVGVNLTPFSELERVYSRLRAGEFFSQRVLYGIWGVGGNLLLFVPWAFLAWKYLDGHERTPLRTHVDVLLLGFLFILGVEAIQLFIPTRATDIDDVVLNLAGTLLGSMIAHLGREIRIEWAR